MRTSGGCISCKRRRKKCDLTKPVCRGCQRNFLLCSWDSPNLALGTTPGEQQSPSTRRWSTQSPTQQSKAAQTEVIASLQASMASAARFSRSPNNLHPALKRPESQFLFTHFLHRTAGVLSVSKGHNPFVDVLVPVALQSDMVLQALLTLSGVHLLQGGTQCYGAATWEHQAQALRSLKYGVTKFVMSETDLAYSLSICTLIFCFIEVTSMLSARRYCYGEANIETIEQVIGGDTKGNMFHHMKATEQLLLAKAMPLTDQNDPNLRTFILEWYSYISALSAICYAKSNNFSTPLFDGICDELLAQGASRPGVLFGCSRELFVLIPRVILIAQRIPQEQEEDGCISCPTSLERDRLLHSVQTWKPSSSANADCAAAGKIYQLALSALLQIDMDNATLQHHVASVASLLQALPISSQVTTTLCWPLSILGSLARLDSCKSSIRCYLELLATRYRFGNFQQSLHLLDTLWKENEAPIKSILSIQSVMKRNGYYFTFA